MSLFTSLATRHSCSSLAHGLRLDMGRAIYCPFPACTVEYYTYCPKHQVIQPAVEQVAEHIDPENILTRSVVYANLMPMIRLLEEQWREIHLLERSIRHLESEQRRVNGH